MKSKYQTIKLLILSIVLIVSVIIPSFAGAQTFTKDLQKGSSGGEVKVLQQFLNKLGYVVTPKGQEINYFGNQTASAVSAFQKKFNIPVSGKLDFTTRDVVNSALFATPLVLGASTESSVTYNRTLKNGSVGVDVKSLQNFLIKAGYRTQATGYFGSITKTALMLYQKDHNLAVDGSFGLATRASVGGASASSAEFVTSNSVNTSATYTLTINWIGTGNGNVGFNAAGCGESSCIITLTNTGGSITKTYPSGLDISLKAVPSTGSKFDGWSGTSCLGSDVFCRVILNGNKTVTVGFSSGTISSSGNKTLTITKTGNGAGSIESYLSDNSKSTDLVKSYSNGTPLTLFAIPTVGSKFVGWSGACSGTLACVVEMGEDRSVVANFSLVTSGEKYLSVGKVGNGEGIISLQYQDGSNYGYQVEYNTTNPGSIINVPSGGKNFMLLATPSENSKFDGWVGRDCVQLYTAQCVRVSFYNFGSLNKNLVAKFSLKDQPASTDTKTLTIRKSGSGIGSISVKVGRSTNGAVAVPCDADGVCTTKISKNESVEVYATADGSSRLDNWSGVHDGSSVCGNSNMCSFTMTGDKYIVVNFSSVDPILESYLLTVKVLGGDGTVTMTAYSGSNPTYRSDGVTTQRYPKGYKVGIIGFERDGKSEFKSWGGACSSVVYPQGEIPALPTCDVTMNSDTTVIVNFATTSALYNYTLNLLKGGNGFGKIQSVSPPYAETSDFDLADHPGGLHNEGTTYGIKAIPDSGSTFTGWSGGGCLGNGNCNVLFDANKFVTANFSTNAVVTSAILTVAKSGGGNGRVTSLTGISCGTGATECSKTYSNTTTSVTLKAESFTGYKFDGWTGDCANYGLNNTCTLLVNGNKTVGANFVAGLVSAGGSLTVTKLGGGSGNITGTGISCGTGGSDCTESFNSTTNVTLTASPSSGYKFDGWTGDCVNFGVSTACVIPMAGSKSAGAGFSVSTVVPAVVPVGICGTSNRTTFSTVPTSYLCAIGTASTPTGSGPWNWTCTPSGGTATSCSANKTVVNTTPSITVTSPNGGESWPQGSTRTITWSSVNVPTDKTISIHLSNGKGGSGLLAQNIPGSATSYSWQIPTPEMTAFIVPGNTYKVFVGFESEGIYDYSNNYFSITAASLSTTPKFDKISSVANVIQAIKEALSGF